MRSTSVFYNYFSNEEDCITAVVTLPYTPKSLEYFNPSQLYHIVKSFGMKTK